MTVMLNGETTKKANISLDFLYKTFGPQVFSGQYFDCHAYGHIWLPNTSDPFGVS
jgi:hypothetical protein